MTVCIYEDLIKTLGMYKKTPTQLCIARKEREKKRTDQEADTSKTEGSVVPKGRYSPTRIPRLIVRLGNETQLSQADPGAPNGRPAFSIPGKQTSSRKAERY